MNDPNPVPLSDRVAPGGTDCEDNSMTEASTCPDGMKLPTDIAQAITIPKTGTPFVLIERTDAIFNDPRIFKNNPPVELHGVIAVPSIES